LLANASVLHRLKCRLKTDIRILVAKVVANEEEASVRLLVWLENIFASSILCGGSA